MHEGIAPITKFTFRTLATPWLVCALALGAAAPLLADESTEPSGAAAGQATDTVPSPSNWRVGFSVGALQHWVHDAYRNVNDPQRASGQLVRRSLPHNDEPGF